MTVPLHALLYFVTNLVESIYMIKNRYVSHFIASLCSAAVFSVIAYAVMVQSFNAALPALFSAAFWAPFFTLFALFAVAGAVSCILTQMVNSAGHKVVLKASGRELGTVKWFNTSKGFGFITRNNGDDVFVHYRSIRGKGHRFLVENQKVQFTLTEGDKGWQAEDVIVAS